MFMPIRTRFTSHLLLALIAYWLWMTESLCATTDEEIYQDLLSGKRSLAAVGKVNDRVILVVQPTNGSIPLNDTYVFEAVITNDDYTELVLQNGQLIGEHWPNFPALTQPLLTAFFLRDHVDHYYLIVCQEAINDLDCRGIQADNQSPPMDYSVIPLPKLKQLYATPTMMSDTGVQLNSFNLYNGGPERVDINPYTYQTGNDAGGKVDDSLTWQEQEQNFVLCNMNEARDQVKVVDTYAQDCTTLGWGVVSNAFFDEHHFTFFTKDGIYRMDRFGVESINLWVNVHQFTWKEYFRLATSSDSPQSNTGVADVNGSEKKGLSVGGIVVIVVVVIFLVMLALTVLTFYLCGLGSGFTSSGGGSKSQKTAGGGGKKAASKAPQQSSKKNKSKATSKK